MGGSSKFTYCFREPRCYKVSDLVPLRVSGNRVLRRIFGPKGEEVTEKWRKLHDK
jgi:hypothetical protein